MGFNCISLAFTKRCKHIKELNSMEMYFCLLEKKFCHEQFLAVCCSPDLKRLILWSLLFLQHLFLDFGFQHHMVASGVVAVSCAVQIAGRKQHREEKGVCFPAESAPPRKFCATLKMISLDFLIQPHLLNARVEGVPLERVLSIK